jgi:hypothetical protein
VLRLPSIEFVHSELEVAVLRSSVSELSVQGSFGPRALNYITEDIALLVGPVPMPETKVNAQGPF